MKNSYKRKRVVANDTIMERTGRIQKRQLHRRCQETSVDTEHTRPGYGGARKAFGKGIADALEHMLQQARGDGFKAYNVEGYAGCIEYGEGEESIGVLVHMDVVPPGEGWTTPLLLRI
ncbi:hypothetical protein [Paenibacillus larvae]|uniref:hypothetical protein n=1 Tax=Paenibacillus larvae TaxID=1464 RepID=UPI00288ECD49|nr:hypothetical protein [Paenibacillus larvae]MDT2192820.1 hypothetical protein [Paenibacillus larvae]